MKKNIGALILSAIMMTSISVNVSATENIIPKVGIHNNGNQIDRVNMENRENVDKDLLRKVKRIIQIKELYPNLTDEEILNKLEKEENMGGLINRANALESIFDTWNQLSLAEKLLVVKYPKEALLVNSAKNNTDKILNKRYGIYTDGSEGNAFRHALWNAMMARDIGHFKANLFGTAHEKIGKLDDTLLLYGFTQTQHRDMDLHNNYVGRSCVRFVTLLSNETLTNRVQEKLDNGELIILVK